MGPPALGRQRGLGRSAPQCGNSWVAESSKRTRRKRTAEAFVLGPEFGNLHLRRFKPVRGQTLGATTSCSPFGLLGVPALRPPLCSPGLDPRGMFATFATFSVRPLIFLHNHLYCAKWYPGWREWPFSSIRPTHRMPSQR